MITQAPVAAPKAVDSDNSPLAEQQLERGDFDIKVYYRKWQRVSDQNISSPKQQNIKEAPIKVNKAVLGHQSSPNQI